MSHIPQSRIHAFQKRAVPIEVDVETTLTPQDLTGIVFQLGSTTKTGLTAQTGGSGLIVDVTLTAADLDVAPGVYRWECRATIGGELRSLAHGAISVDAEPTTT